MKQVKKVQRLNLYSPLFDSDSDATCADPGPCAALLLGRILCSARSSPFFECLDIKENTFDT